MNIHIVAIENMDLCHIDYAFFRTKENAQRYINEFSEPNCICHSPKHIKVTENFCFDDDFLGWTQEPYERELTAVDYLTDFK